MKIKKSELLALIKEEIMAEARFDRGMTIMDDPYDDYEADMMQEGLEGINPENMQIVMDALQKLLFSPYTGPMIAAAFAAVGVQIVREMFGKRGSDE